MFGRFMPKVVLSFALLVGNCACADFTSWQDSNYDFTKIKTIYVAQMDMEEAEIESLVKERTLSEELAKKLSSVKELSIVTESLNVHTDLFAEAEKKLAKQASAKKSYELPTKDSKVDTDNKETQSDALSDSSDEEDSDEIVLGENVLASGAEIFIQPFLHTYSVATELIPAHTEWRTRRIDRSWVDHKGKVHRDYYTETFPYYVPDTYVSHALVSCSFEWYDVKTGNLIASSEDSRDKRYSDDPIDVYQRIIDRFVKNLKKTFKKE